MNFKIHSKFKPMGDQINAIDVLSKNIIDKGRENLYQTLLGVTGSGKTFTIANVIEKVNKPTIVMAHNKTLAGQLYSEFKEFFPDNAVEYFISYYDYYQPEAYISSTDTYIEKDSSINDEIDKLRHSATAALIERKDVIIIASVSSIYSLGSPEEYEKLTLSVRPGMTKSREEILDRLVEMQFTRGDIDFVRGTFRVKGDIIDIFPVGTTDHAVRVELLGDEIEKVSHIHPLTSKQISSVKHELIYPKSHYVTSRENVEKAIGEIKTDLEIRLKELREASKIVEAYRLEQRVNFDIEMLEETGFCQGIENYSIYMSGREKGSTPSTLFDYLGDDFLIIADESHVTVPQIGAMYNGDRARKENLVDYGFRLPSAFDNRPLKFEEWEKKAKNIIYVSATPGNYEKDRSKCIAEQIIRPTGLLDPKIVVKPKDGQIEDLIENIYKAVEVKEKILVTTLTKKMAEELTSYLSNKDIRVRYMHSDIKALDRLDIIRDLRMDKFDVLIGINLLREGIDIPEVSLVAILDADKEGFLRSERSLVQTIGRAARHQNGRVIMYADELTKSMEAAISETNRRRKIQEEYNEKNNITPIGIKKEVRDSITISLDDPNSELAGLDIDIKKGESVEEAIEKLTKEMMKYAKAYEFEKAAMIRDLIKDLRG